MHISLEPVGRYALSEVTSEKLQCMYKFSLWLELMENFSVWVHLHSQSLSVGMTSLPQKKTFVALSVSISQAALDFNLT